jgi:hypothetical protein
MKKVLYVILFDTKGPIILIPVPKGKPVTGNFYKNVVIKKLKYYKSFHLKTSLKYFRLLQDDAPAHNARFGRQKSYCPTTLPFSLDLAPCDLFPVPQSYIPVKVYKSRNGVVSAMMVVPIEEYKYP